MKRITTITVAVTALVALSGVSGAAAKKPPQPPQPADNSLTIAATPPRVVYGHTTVISGKLKGPNHSGQSVSLRSDPFPYATFTKIATATTNAAGDYAYARQKPLVNTRYQTKVGSVFSPTFTVLVRYRVSLRLSDSTPARGRRVRFFGRSCPREDGHLVRIQRFSRTTHKWRTVARTRLKHATRCSLYSRRVRVFHDGTFRVTVSATGDPAHIRGISRRRRIDVH